MNMELIGLAFMLGVLTSVFLFIYRKHQQLVDHTPDLVYAALVRKSIARGQLVVTAPSEHTIGVPVK